MNLIEQYLSAAGIAGHEAATIREAACKVREFYSTGENLKDKPGISTRQAKQALLALNLPNEHRIELARRIDKWAVQCGGAPCDGSIMTRPSRWSEPKDTYQKVIRL